MTVIPVRSWGCSAGTGICSNATDSCCATAIGSIRRLLQRAQGRMASTAVFLTGVVATILGVGGACILMDYTAAALGPAGVLLGALVGAVIAGTVMRVGTRELEPGTAHLADTAMASLDERLP
ncbi:hypothetical protein P3H15_45220 [Rhodococcus sp. T2V]|uniref:hypothetical protein n=1 Tax=Rhodococcus sp. T2V TaxID=3034164 RepID=UPI0023E299F7|nr:hypothetical protein [Rhodococcus sp. T2V]MDF3312175.1 hypothetical protein [Rhodococcus sp. T2V]